MDRNANCVELSTQDLRKLQLIELDLLLELDRICRKNNIHYFLAAGSLLGAVRHKGFIPWDDDLDTHMMREEYDKFRKVCEKDLNTEKYFLQDAKSDPGYRWGYAKLRRKGTEYKRAGQEAIKCMDGVSIDIFVIDRVPDSEWLATVQNIVSRGCIKTLWSVVGVTQDPTLWKRVLYRGIRHIPKRIPLGIIEKMGRRNNKKNYQHIACMSFARADGFLKGQKRFRGVRAEWFSESVEIEFEGFKILTCKDYMLYLEGKYKNIWEYPPKEQQLLHPPRSFNFDVDIDLRGKSVDQYMQHEYLYLTKENYNQ